MYNEKLEQLIDAALADGVLTEKEKQILFKKAQEMGVDLDEFEMVLDARLVKLKKAEEEKAQASAPKSNKLGDVKKCPSCGAIVQSYQGTCAECGYAFENVEANSSSQKLAEELLKLDDKYVQIKNEHMNKINKNPLSSFTSELTQRTDKENKRLNKEHNKAKAQLIKAFAIPSTKADLVEFIATLNVRMAEKSENRYITDAYSIKNKECMAKANLLFANDATFNVLKESYTEANNKWKKQRTWKIVKQYRVGIITAIVLILIYIVLPTIIVGVVKDNKKQKQAKIEQLQTLLDNNDTESATILFKQELSSNEDAEKIMYNGYIKNGLYDEASEFVNNYYPDDYYSYMEKVVTILAENNQKSEAKKFIKRKISYFSKYDDESNSNYNEYNSKLIEKRLNAIINNF